MPRTTHRASTSHDAVFVEWLQRIGAQKYKDKSMLTHYMQRHTDGTWHDMLQHLRTSKVDWWIFIRNQMGKENISSARTRYLDRFVFICKEEPSQPYIDALLEIEACQIQSRIGNTNVTSCPGCKRRDATIAALEAQLGRLGETNKTNERLELMLKEFNRLYVLDEDGHAPRHMVRRDLENYLKRTLGEEEVIAPTGELWNMFISEITTIGGAGYKGLRCRLRQQSLTRALNLAGPSWNDVAASRSHKRDREEA